VARHKERLERHYIVACPNWKVASLFIDKKRTYALAESIGVPSPTTIAPSSLEEVRAYADQVRFPYLVKPCQSHLFYNHFRRKMFCVHSKEEMISVYKRAADAGLEVVLQEIIPGDDTYVVNYNSYFCNGTAALEFTAAHVRNAPPMWGSPRVAVSRDIPEVLAPGRSILRAMGFEGYACTEFKRDARDGSYKLMEVNGRHNLSTLLAVRCGVNFPWLHYKHMACGELPSAQPARTGIYWIDLTRDLGYSAMYVRYEHYSPVQYLAPYFRPHIFAILDWKDPRPFVKRCSFLAWDGLCRLMALLRRLLPKTGARKAPFHFLGRLFKT
jgi:predicted ATP-grasp superfamily ATP-dependent carboligase